MPEFASKGVAGTALGLGAGALGVELLRGGLGGLLGGMGNCGCNEDHTVNRYEAAQSARIAELETEVKLRDANIYTDQKSLALYQYIDGKLEHINRRLCEQDVWNTAQTGAMNCMAQQIAALNGLTKTVIPATSICPEVMPRYNSWTAPAAPTTGA